MILTMEFIMKKYIDIIFKDISMLTLISSFVFLQACQGGGSSDSEQGENNDTQLNSTRLSDNLISENTNFYNFKDTTIRFDPSSLAFSGDRLYLKINRDNEEVLYLGEIDRYLLFTVKIHTPLDESLLYYEVFTNDINDTTQFGVIEL